jgi:hypothetical protein
MPPACCARPPGCGACGCTWPPPSPWRRSWSGTCSPARPGRAGPTSPDGRCCGRGRSGWSRPAATSPPPRWSGSPGSPGPPVATPAPTTPAPSARPRCRQRCGWTTGRRTSTRTAGAWSWPTPTVSARCRSTSWRRLTRTSGRSWTAPAAVRRPALDRRARLGPGAPPGRGAELHVRSVTGYRVRFPVDARDLRGTPLAVDAMVLRPGATDTSPVVHRQLMDVSHGRRRYWPGLPR